MNEIKKCSISGIAFIFEKVAYNRLSEYIASLKQAYKGSEECDEIIADIEARIAELILSTQNNTEQVVCLPLIENIIQQMGTAEDISNNEPTEPATDTRIARRLYRDMSNHKLGGVCAGLGRYFSIDPVLIRLAMFAPLILMPISNFSHHLHWMNDLGGNLFGIFVATYLIMWFVVPQAKTARQKLEMEGEAVTAKSIAERQENSTDEEQAKSTLATFVARVGKLALVCLKAVVIIMIFPLVLAATGLICSIVAVITGYGMPIFSAGNLGTITEIISNCGIGLSLAGIGIVLVPIITLTYVLIALLLGRRPKWWALIVALIAWIMLFIGVFNSATQFIATHPESEIERILKDSSDECIFEPIDSTQYRQLINDPNAISID